MTGHIDISWTLTPTSEEKHLLRFQWIERNSPPVEEPKAKGFGSRLISRALAADFNGEVEVGYLPSGIVCVITANLQLV
jgi:two-component sensor histidine kinase